MTVSVCVISNSSCFTSPRDRIPSSYAPHHSLLNTFLLHSQMSLRSIQFRTFLKPTTHPFTPAYTRTFHQSISIMSGSKNDQYSKKAEDNSISLKDKEIEVQAIIKKVGP